MKCTDSDTLTLPPNGHPHWFPRVEWPTWSKPGKWHKWAMQLFISMWHYLQWLFSNMYICHLITYSCTKSIKMLWGLFLPLTNLLISLHQQSSVSLHQGTTFIHSNFQKAFSDIPPRTCQMKWPIPNLKLITQICHQIYPPELSHEVTNTKFEMKYPDRLSDIPPGFWAEVTNSKCEMDYPDRPSDIPMLICSAQDYQFHIATDV